MTFKAKAAKQLVEDFMGHSIEPEDFPKTTKKIRDNIEAILKFINSTEKREDPYNDCLWLLTILHPKNPIAIFQGQTGQKISSAMETPFANVGQKFQKDFIENRADKPPFLKDPITQGIDTQLKEILELIDEYKEKKEDV